MASLKDGCQRHENGRYNWMIRPCFFLHACDTCHAYEKRAGINDLVAHIMLMLSNPVLNLPLCLNPLIKLLYLPLSIRLKLSRITCNCTKRAYIKQFKRAKEKCHLKKLLKSKQFNFGLHRAKQLPFQFQVIEIRQLRCLKDDGRHAEEHDLLGKEDAGGV